MTTKKFTDMKLDEIEQLSKPEWKRIWKTTSGLRMGPKILDIKAEKAYSEYMKIINMQKMMKQIQLNKEMTKNQQLNKIVEPELDLGSL